MLRPLGALLLLLALAGGCVPASENPLSDPAAARADPRLAGYWIGRLRDSEVDSHLHFVPREGGRSDVLLVAEAPADNPTTPDRVELGKMLYFDPRLSSNGTVSCFSCHNVMEGGDDHRPTSIGVHGQAGGRSAPTVWNAAFLSAQFWDGRAATLDHRLMMNDGDRHGRTSGLSPTQRADLIRYLESL